MYGRAAGGSTRGRLAGVLPVLVLAGLALAGCGSAVAAAGAPVPDAIEAPLAEGTADPVRGRSIAFGRDGNCLLCHPLSDAGRPTGNLAPPLDGVGGRLSAGRIRSRLVNPALVNPHTIMPSYFVVEGLNRVAEPWRGRPILDAQQIEDLVAWLQTLR